MDKAGRRFVVASIPPQAEPKQSVFALVAHHSWWVSLFGTPQLAVGSLLGHL